MPRTLIVTEPPAAPEPLRLALMAAGHSIVDEIDDVDRLLKRAVAIDPDLLVIASAAPSTALLAALGALDQVAPCTVLLYTADDDPRSIDAATAAGVDAYVVDGFSARRLPSVIAAARARYKRIRSLRENLAVATARLEERKLIDRAKGILMHSRNMSEDEAYGALRSLAMESKQKLGTIAEKIITAARLLA